MFLKNQSLQNFGGFSRKTPVYCWDLALSLVSVLNLIPPMVMGRVIDAITWKTDQSDFVSESRLFAFGSSGMYYLRYVWRMYILATSYQLGPDYAFTPI